MYVSKSQARAFHAKEKRGEISHKVVKEFDKATKGKFGKLPEHVKHKKHAAHVRKSKKNPHNQTAHGFDNFNDSAPRAMGIV